MTTARRPLWVVVPAHNAAEHIERAVRSALAHAGADRVLVIDDESTDSTGEAARRAGATVVRQGNGGPGRARNRGLDQAESAGADVLTLDADDELLPGASDEIKAAASRQPVPVMVVGDFDRRGRTREEDAASALARPLRAMGLRPAAALSPMAPITASGLWLPHETIARGLRFEPGMFTAEDRDLIFRAHQDKAEHIVVTGKPVFIKHEVRGQMTADLSLSGHFLRDVLRLVERHGDGLAEEDRRGLAPMVQYYLKRACRLAAWRGVPMEQELWVRAADTLRALGAGINWRTWKWYCVARASGLVHGRWRAPQTARA